MTTVVFNVDSSSAVMPGVLLHNGERTLDVKLDVEALDLLRRYPQRAHVVFNRLIPEWALEVGTTIEVRIDGAPLTNFVYDPVKWYSIITP